MNKKRLIEKYKDWLKRNSDMYKWLRKEAISSLKDPEINNAVIETTTNEIGDIDDLENLLREKKGYKKRDAYLIALLLQDSFPPDDRYLVAKIITRS